MRLNGDRVAVIGAGPAGLTVAKHLIEQGFTPVVLEQSDDLGGQWNSGAAHSGVWEGMRTNTSKGMTAFSDFPPAAELPMFPTAEQIHDYLRAYAERFGVTPHVRTGVRVTGVERSAYGGGGAPCGWSVRWTDAATGRADSGFFDGVVVASGRFSRPSWPDVPGLRGFGGRLMHAFDYRSREELAGKRVLVYGNSISGLEIASDLAADESIAVISAARRGRFIIRKVVDGVPSDWHWFTRFAALLGRALPPDALAEGLRQQLLAVAGDPARYGALAPDENLLATGLSQAQDYLALVAEGRIAARPGVVSVSGNVVELADGSREEVDAIVCATGYDLALEYLDPSIRTALGEDGTLLDLHGRTFHPDFPGLAFAGQFVLHGPYFPVLELQARWLARAFAGSGPSEEQMREGVAAYRRMRPMLRFEPHHAVASMLAAELGVTPSLTARPELTAALLFGPLLPAQYRLDGPGALPGAQELFVRALDGFECDPSPEQLGGLAMVADVLGDPELHRALEALAEPALVE